MHAPPQTDASQLSSEDLARERTLMALDRTQMAWVRTGLSMLTFGFSVIKFFQFLRQEAPAGSRAASGIRPFGLAIMALGLFALAMATWQYIRQRRRLKGPSPYRSPAFLVGLVLLLVQGVALAWSILER